MDGNEFVCFVINYSRMLSISLKKCIINNSSRMIECVVHRTIQNCIVRKFGFFSSSNKRVTIAKTRFENQQINKSVRFST